MTLIFLSITLCLKHSVSFFLVCVGVLCLFRRQVSQLEEGDAGTLHPVYQVTCQPWITFMANLGKLFSPGIAKPLTEGLIIYLFFNSACQSHSS